MMSPQVGVYGWGLVIAEKFLQLSSVQGHKHSLASTMHRALGCFEALLLFLCTLCMRALTAAAAAAAAEAVYSLGLAARAHVEAVLLGDSSTVAAAATVAYCWCSFIEACRTFTSSKSAHAALLLTGPLLQLVARILERPRIPAPLNVRLNKLNQLLLVPVTTFQSALHPSAHPGLQRWLPGSSSLSPQQLEVCDVNVRTALQQQVRQGTPLRGTHVRQVLHHEVEPVCHLAMCQVVLHIQSMARCICHATRVDGAAV